MVVINSGSRDRMRALASRAARIGWASTPNHVSRPSKSLSSEARTESKSINNGWWKLAVVGGVAVVVVQLYSRRHFASWWYDLAIENGNVQIPSYRINPPLERSDLIDELRAAIVPSAQCSSYFVVFGGVDSGKSCLVQQVGRDAGSGVLHIQIKSEEVRDFLIALGRSLWYEPERKDENWNLSYLHSIVRGLST